MTDAELRGLRLFLRGADSLGLCDAEPLSDGLALPLTHAVPLAEGVGCGDGVDGGGSHCHEKPYGVPGATSPYTASAMLSRLPAYSAEFRSVTSGTTTRLCSSPHS